MLAVMRINAAMTFSHEPMARKHRADRWLISPQRHQEHVKNKNNVLAIYASIRTMESWHGKPA
jgi:hypothetical protein